MKRKFLKIAAYMKRLTYICIISGIFLTAAVLLINTYMKNSVKDRILVPELTAGLKADCIIVLGAGVHGKTPSNMLEDRLLRGIELYNLSSSGKLLMSGDHGRNNYDEVNVMKPTFFCSRQFPHNPLCPVLAQLPIFHISIGNIRKSKQRTSSINVFSRKFLA